MKKNLLLPLLLFVFIVIFTSCDERVNVAPSTAVAVVSKTDLIVRKWGIAENYFDIDGKKTIIYGPGRPANLTIDVSGSPNDYFSFSKDGKLEVYIENKKTTTNGTWKFLNNESQVELVYGKEKYTMDINSLTDKTADMSVKILAANIANESQSNQGLFFIAALGGLATESSKIIKFGFKFATK